MYQRDFEYLNKNIDNILSVVLMADSFFYSIIDSSYCVLAHKSFENIRYSDSFSTAKIIEDLMLNQEYKLISVLVLMDECTFLPNLDHELVQIMPAFESKKIKFEKFLGKDVYTYFAITPNQEKLLDQVFLGKEYQIHHISNAMMSFYVANQQKVIHGHIEQNHLHLYHMDAGEFKFYRSFPTHGIKDVLYYITAIYKEHQLDMNADHLVLSGWVEMESPLYKLISGYVGNVSLQNSPLFSTSDHCNEMVKPHFYFVHHINALCAS